MTMMMMILAVTDVDESVDYMFMMLLMVVHSRG